MMYLIYSSEQDAVDRSEQIAIDKGCNGDITTYWYGWLVHPTLSPATALIIPEDQINYLNPSEQSLLQTEAEMQANGWFVNPQP
jgi:hypothetical protein